MAASYPAALHTESAKADGVDWVLAEHMNEAHEEIIAIETELGTDVAGSMTNLKTRLAVSIANDGSITLPNTTSSSTGVITKGGIRFLHNFQHPTGGGAIPVGRNVFLGSTAGNFTLGSTATITSHGSYNTGVGFAVLSALTKGYYNTAMAYGSLSLLTEGAENTCVGPFSLYNLTTSSQNSAFGYSAGQFIANGVGANTSVSGCVYLGHNTKASAVGASNEIVIGYNAIGQGSNTIMLGNSSITSLLCYDTTITSPSDRRIKTNIEALEPDKMLGFITSLEPVMFNKINPIKWDKEIKPSDLEEVPNNPAVYAGLIAQNVEEAMKEWDVDYELVPRLPNGLLALRYTDFIPALIGAVIGLSNKLDKEL